MRISGDFAMQSMGAIDGFDAGQENPVARLHGWRVMNVAARDTNGTDRGHLDVQVSSLTFLKYAADRSAR
jgi:hypothetical protein